jgi:hypothetical protein
MLVQKSALLPTEQIFGGNANAQQIMCGQLRLVRAMA